MRRCSEENVGVLRVRKARERINTQKVPSVGVLRRLSPRDGLVPDYGLGKRVFVTHHQIFMPTGSSQILPLSGDIDPSLCSAVPLLE